MEVKQSLAFVLILLNLACQAKADCDAPTGFKNAKLLSDLSDQPAVFEEKHELLYECNIGFRPATGRGSRCWNGRWTEIRCERIFCKWLPAPDNGRRLDSNAYVGEYTTFACNEGYQLIGYKTLLCRADGKWRPSDPPVCKPVSCGRLPWLTNGEAFQATRDGNLNLYGSVVKLSCKFGFDLIKGSKERRCQADGTWSGTQPVCEEPTCPKLEPVYNGVIYYQNDDVISLYHVAEIECNDGSDVFPEGTRFVTCVEGNTWDVNNITCERHLTISPPSHMKLYTGQGRYRPRITSSRRLKSRTSLHIECEYKHELVDGKTNKYYEVNSLQVRIFNGTVVPELPLCRKERCNLVADHCSFMDTDGNKLVGKVEHNTVVVKMCDPDFEFEPSDKRKEPRQRSTCNQGVIDFPRCIPKRCVIPPGRGAKWYRRNYNDGDLFNNGQTVKRTCSGKRELFYPETQTYEENSNIFSSTCRTGVWSNGVFPICKEKRCNIVIDHCSFMDTDGNNLVGKVEHNTVVVKKCDPGFEFEPSDKRKEPNQKSTCDRGVIDFPRCIPKEFYYDYPGVDEVKPEEFYYDYPGVDEVKSEETCPNPANGRQVRSYLSYFNVVCDDGYELYVVKNDDDYKCSNGKWMSKNFGFEAECNENDCEITDEILAVMKVFNRVNGKEQYESRVRKITPNQKYYFDCKQENHEPFKRLFNCSRGNWTAIERDPNWKMQIDGMEPSCRKALCDPVCQFGGTCVKDGMCKCVPGTTGKACEIPVCNPACASNGGKCGAPNTCKCEEPSYGINCEQVGCDRPNFPVHVIMKRKKNFFEDGDVLSSDQLTCSKGYILSNTTRCIGNQTWSGKAECLKETHFELEMKVGTSRWAGSWGQLYVTILSEQDKIIHRMAFEKPDFPGLFPDQLYPLRSSTTGETMKVGQLKLQLGPDQRGHNDVLEIDHIRLTIQHAADNITEEYDFSSVGWLNVNQAKLVHPDETRDGLEVKVGNSQWAGSWSELYVSILSEQGEIIHRMAFEKPDFPGLLRGQLYTLGSSTTGETRKVGKLKLLLGPGNRGINDNLEIDHIRLTIQRDADNTKKEYDFSSVGWLNKNQQKLVGPDTRVFRLKYRLGDANYAGSSDTLHISFEGNLGHTPFYLMSSGRRNEGQTYYKVIDGEYVGQIHTVTIVNQKNMVPNYIQIDYIELTVSHEDKEEKYIFRNVGWIGSPEPEITADQPELP